jgi:4-deoxy-L-threo-5-hexosulose-uronate ketol-isomerase
MTIRFQHSAGETKAMSTAQLRENYLMQDLMKADEITLFYTHYDRMIIGGVRPENETISLPNDPELRADYFLERRELGIINVGGNGVVSCDGVEHALSKLDCLYVGKGVRDVRFKSSDANSPAVFYLLSAPAHASYPTRKFTKEDAAPVEMGNLSTSNKRTIYKYIHADGIESCQLVMGLTVLAEGSIWNSVPPHTHTRRMEAYFYFDIPDEQRVFHFMGEPKETRHLVVANHEAIVSPPWSVHFGAGTSNYGFIWGMAGENKAYTDMDAVPVPTIE